MKSKTKKKTVVPRYPSTPKPAAPKVREFSLDGVAPDLVASRVKKIGAIVESGKSLHQDEIHKILLGG